MDSRGKQEGTAIPRSLSSQGFSLAAEVGELPSKRPDTGSYGLGSLAALHKLDTLNDAAWRDGLEEFLRRYHDELPIDPAERLDPVKLEGYIAIALEYRNLLRTRELLARTVTVTDPARGSRPSLSLAEIARAGQGEVLDPKKQWLQLRDRVLTPMDELKLWDVTWGRRKKLDATGTTAAPTAGRNAQAQRTQAGYVWTRYDIRPGQALLWFYEEHYLEWRMGQLKRAAEIMAENGFDASVDAKPAHRGVGGRVATSRFASIENGPAFTFEERSFEDADGGVWRYDEEFTDLRSGCMVYRLVEEGGSSLRPEGPHSRQYLLRTLAEEANRLGLDHEAEAFATAGTELEPRTASPSADRPKKSWAARLRGLVGANRTKNEE